MNRRHFLSTGLPLSLLVKAQSSGIPLLRGLSRTNLLEYRDGSGRIRTATRASQWQRYRRREALAGMHEVTGPLPGKQKRCSLDVTVQEEADMGSYVRRAIQYSSEPDCRTTAYLCLPKAALAGKPAAGVLCLHPTDNIFGYKVVVGLGGDRTGSMPLNWRSGAL